MPVLKRLWRESLQIGDDIKLSIVEIVGQRVCIEIVAPPDIAIHLNDAGDFIPADDAPPQTADELQAAAGL